MPPRHYLRCLGVPELRAPGGEPIRFRTRKHMALLAFLAVEPRQPHRRERLADLLWPDASPAEGRHSLATALSVLRGKLGPRTFETTRETVRFIAPDLEVDLDRLARGDILGDELTPPLEMGGFLDDFEVNRAPEFILWRELRRAHWFPAIRRAFIVLMDGCRRTGDFSRIELLADQLLVLDELCEDAIRAKMEGRAFAGDRMSALRIYQEWRRKLEEELGATPSPLVEGMALRLRQRGFEPPGSANVPTVLTDQWRDRAFVGRGAQYRVCYDHWEETREGRGRHILLLGDSGVGKTTLVERLTTAAGLEGAVSARVQCYEVEREIPYSAIGTLVRGMLDRPGATATAPEWLAELARAVPAVAQRFANLPAPRDTEGEAARLRLTEAVHQLATTIAEEHPLILVVDDVHLSDDASVAVLHLLMRRTQEQRIMVILGAREPELARSPNASRLQEVREALALRPVEVPPLTEEEMGEVIGALAEAHQSRLTPAVRRALVRAAAGIPMIGELLFDDWRAHGDHCLALGIGAMTVDADGVGQELYRELADRVMRGLGETARAVLNLAAILGDRLNDLAMYELVDLSLGQTLTGMAELTTQRVLRDDGRGLEFRNEVLRGYAYLLVPSPHRRALHALIGDKLMDAERVGESVPGLTLAWHCYRAGRLDLAHSYLLRGSREAINKGGSFEAELALSSALKGLPQTAIPEASLLLCESLQQQSRWSESLEILQRVTCWPETLSTNTASFEVRARAGAQPSATTCAGLLRDAIEIIRRPVDIQARLPAIKAASQLCVYLGDAELAGDALKVALDSVRGAHDLVAKIETATALAAIAWTTGGLRHFPDLRVALDRLSEECHQTGLESEAAYTLENTRGALAVCCGDYAQALERYTRARKLAKNMGSIDRESYATSNQAMCHGRLGNYDSQRDLAQAAIGLVAAHPSVYRRGRAWLQLAWSFAMRGDTIKALDASEKLIHLDQDSPAWLYQAHHLLRADILWLCGENRAAINVARKTFEMCGPKPLAVAFIGVIARWLALTATESGEDREIEGTFRGILEESDQFDLADKAQALAASVWLAKKKSSEFPGKQEEELGRCLAALPAAFTHQLSRLGFGPN